MSDCVWCAALWDDQVTWKPIKDMAEHVYKCLKVFGEIMNLRGASTRRDKEILTCTRRLTQLLGRNHVLRKQMAKMGHVYMTKSEVLYELGKGRMQTRLVEKRQEWKMEEGQRVETWFVRVAKDKGQLFGQWAKERLEDGLLPKEEKGVEEEILEAILGISWLEDFLGKTLGWGDMQRVYKYITRSILSLEDWELREKIFP